MSEQMWRKSSYSGSEAECVEVSTWRKASYSGSEANCVEVADKVRAVLVRDTKNRESATLGFSAAAWRAFTGGLKQA